MMVQQPPIPTPTPGVDLDTVIAALTPLIFGVMGLIVGGVVLYRFLKSDLAAALAARIRGRGKSSELVEGDTGHAEELEQRMVVMQGQIAEMAERLDFAERLLAQKRERSLPGA
jgi:hypothetical protein